jgi:hypothetical protein
LKKFLLVTVVAKTTKGKIHLQILQKISRVLTRSMAYPGLSLRDKVMLGIYSRNMFRVSGLLCHFDLSARFQVYLKFICGSEVEGLGGWRKRRGEVKLIIVSTFVSVCTEKLLQS